MLSHGNNHHWYVMLSHGKQPPLIRDVITWQQPALIRDAIICGTLRPYEPRTDVHCMFPIAKCHGQPHTCALMMYVCSVWLPVALPGRPLPGWYRRQLYKQLLLVHSGFFETVTYRSSLTTTWWTWLKVLHQTHERTQHIIRTVHFVNK